MLKSCCVCGAGTIAKKFEKEKIDYYKCLKCGFLFSLPDVNANMDTAFDDYESAYKTYLGNSADDDRNFKTLVRWAGNYARLDKGPVLDVGCGSGKLVRFLRRRSVEAYGIEPAEPLYARFLANDPHFFCTAIETVSRDVPVRKFSVIFACDVIEHVPRPDVFLAGMAAVLEPGGVICLSTPDRGSVVARICGRRWHFHNKYHLCYFSRKTISHLAHRHGLREVGYAHLCRWKTVGYLAQYMKDFVIGTGTWRPPALFNRIVVPVNMGDVMHVVLQKEQGDDSACKSRPTDVDIADTIGYNGVQ